MNAMSKSSKAGGCGCGGSGGGCGCGGGGGCGCGGSKTAMCVSGEVGCTTCNDQGFARPVFFAGQLLTEEDLQALGDYVVGKNRLHNRHLFGDGVVCGLEVICNPCGGGRVTVQPGYALDCCGNDLLLPCPTELDINAMARDLRRNMLGGNDCGDPCADKKKLQPAPTPPAQTGRTSNQGTTTDANMRLAPGQQPAEQPRATTTTTAPTRHYCLYAHYCEEKTDPVSPYSTDDGCTYQACQPTRVREGVRFELRCGGCECPDQDILSRLCNCIGDSAGARESAQQAANLQLMADTFAPRVVAIQEDTAIPTRTQAQISREFLMTAAKMNDFSTAARTQQPAATEAEKTAAGAKPSNVDPNQPSAATQPPASSAPASLSEEELDRRFLTIREAKSNLAAFHMAQGEGGEGVAEAEAAKIEAARKRALDTIVETNLALDAAPLSQFKSEIYRAEFKDALLLFSTANPQEALSIRQLEGMKLGDVPPSIFAKALAEAKSLREWLLDRLDGSPRVSDCQLRRDVNAIRLPASEQGSSEELRAAINALGKAYLRYVMDCVCLALNPPCAPCDDTGVLLACLEIDEDACEVVAICNLKRKFVITSMALRYWVPPIGMLGELVERLCCPEPICDDDTQLQDVTGISLTDLQSDRMRIRIQKFVVGALLKLCGRDEDRRVRVAPAVTGATKSTTDMRTAASGADAMRAMLRDFVARVSTPAEKAQPLTERRAEAQPVTRTPTPEELIADTERIVKKQVEEKMAAPEFREEMVKGFRAEADHVVRDTVARHIEELAKHSAAGAGAQPATAVVSEEEIKRVVNERATALFKERFDESVAEAMKSDAVTKVIGDFIIGGTAEPAAGGEGAIAEAASAAAVAEIKKLKLADAAKEIREMKRMKTDNADLRKTVKAHEQNIATLIERVKKLEGGS